MREPAFWYQPQSWTARSLTPLAAIYGAITVRRMARKGTDAGLPVICIGNYHVGGAGKTPATLKLAEILGESGETPFVVSRGYGGILQGPLRVDIKTHTARDVGDEPLMMASRTPVIVSRDRVAGSYLAKEQGASVILLDDGFQNPALVKDASLIVIDSGRGIGNGCVFPAGPLRVPLSPQIARTDALIVVGKGHAADTVASMVMARGQPVLRAALVPTEPSLAVLRGKPVLAFAGIGDPARFFATLRASGVDVVEERIFADHQVFALADIDRLSADAASKSLTLVTTEKDMVRIRSDQRLAHHAASIAVFAVKLDFDDEATLRDFLTAELVKARRKGR